jgi:hypothetical protein
MQEAGCVLDRSGAPIHWHEPDGRTGISLPDSVEFWKLIFENRDRIGGIAHSHPGGGRPSPSHEDVTTFSAIDLALGKRLDWWIASDELVVRHRWLGPGAYDYAADLELAIAAGPPWAKALIALSKGE